MNYPTLAEVITKSEKVYLDNSILDKDINRNEVLASRGGNHDKPILSIAPRLGAASNFREVKYQSIHRQALYATRLYSLISENQKVESVPSVIAEYDRFILALESSLKFLSSHSSTKKRGEKQRALEEAIKYHRMTYYELAERSDISDRTVSVAQVMRNLRMHMSIDKRFVKRLGRMDPDASPGDTELAAEALVHAAEYSGDVILITADTDIVNLIHNFGILSARHSLPPALKALSPQGKVKVYYPSSNYWVPHFGISLADCVSTITENVSGSRIRNYSASSSK